jgi:hypothetical protein
MSGAARDADAPIEFPEPAAPRGQPANICQLAGSSSSPLVWKCVLLKPELLSFPFNS